MKFLVDQPVSPLVAAWLRSESGGGHDAIHVRECGMASAADDVIFAKAVAEDRVIITVDLDFARIAALSGRAGPGLVLFRAGNVSDQEMLNLLRRVLAELPIERLSRCVVVVDEYAIRVSALPITPRG
ncbi:MAG: DUF5615 family PIN-like protein [bacterium]|jgi:predicted nuclease of predicted toxin-antitoxin system|nr:DUF5615 family PIN-like protein [Phycisphaerales bacterium]MCE2654343.1 DUF5615 family PIN-like protein [Planctomycetaceae bacterium]